MAIRWARAGLGRAKQRPRRRARGRVRSAAHREQYGERCFRRPTAAHNGRALLSTKQKQPSPVSVTLMGLSSRAPQAVQSIPRPLKAPQAVLSTPLRDAQDGLGMLQTVSRCFPTAQRRQQLPRRAPPCLPVRGFGRHDAGSGIMPGVRGTGRGHSPRRDGQDPGQTGKTPVRQAKPRPECHGGHPSERDSPGLTRFTPRPPHTCGRAPGLRTCPRGASATPRHVHNPKTRPQRSESRAAATTGRAPWAGAGGTLQPRLHQADSGTIATTTRYPTNTRCPPRLTGASALRAPHQSGAGPSEVSGDAGNRTPVRRACNRTSPGAARF